MLIAVDVQYADDDDRAGVAAIVLEQWSAPQPAAQLIGIHAGLQPYIPGYFYRRELPCILPLLHRLLGEHEVGDIIVDGYVDLGPGKPGLGRHLFEALDARHCVTGVAKNPFAGSHAVPVLRGAGDRPLWVTSTGDAHAHARDVGRMHGPYRLPTMLKRVDQLARAALSDVPADGPAKVTPQRRPPR